MDRLTPRNLDRIILTALLASDDPVFEFVMIFEYVVLVGGFAYMVVRERGYLRRIH